jgi:hypothetical protein
MNFMLNLPNPAYKWTSEGPYGGRTFAVFFGAKSIKFGINSTKNDFKI